MLVSGDGSPADRASQYNSRLARARAGNLSRRVSGSPQDAGSLMSGNGGSRSRKSGGSDDPDFMSAFDAAPTPPPPTSHSSSGGVGVMESSASGPAPERRPSESELASVPVKGFETLVPAGAGGAVHWAWNARARMIALVDSSQMLKVLNDEGHTVYRVQLPANATTIFVGWEPSGAVLAAVQKLGGAFLWFPSKPEAVQQWEGMQFASQMLKSNVLARNTHFDVSFATWSSAGKLVLGLVDGNFAVWDLASNETFMSRKHFSGKLKGEVSCGAWGPNGENLAVGTTNQIKISQPLAAASWEATAAKIHIQGKSDVHFEDLAFSKSGRLLAALAGSSVFQHLCVYAVRAGGKKGSSLQPLGEVHPSPAIGAFKAFIWLPNDIVAVVTRQGCVWLLEHDVAGGGMAESQVHLGLEGVGTAALASTGYIGIVSLTHLVMFNPLAGDAAASIALPALSSDPTKVEFEIGSAETPGGGRALISLADGALVRLTLPELPELDLSAARVASEVFEERTDGTGGKGWSKPRLFFSMNAGATNGRRCAQSWSAGQGLLATITSSGMLVVLEHKEGAAEPKAVLSMQLPGPDVVFMEWDPAAGTQLAVAVRGAGVVLWKAGSEEKPTLWSGMTYAPVFKLAGSKKEFDPRFARWSRSAQLVVGMGDGSFAVYDSVSGAVFVSGRSGRHKAPITAGDWLSSLFAPALALASTSTVKVSEGFEKMEWEGTAMKLKINEGQDRPHFMPKSAAREKMDKAKEKMKDVTDEAMRTMRRKAKPDIEGTEFKDVAFSPSGKYLACLGAPTMEPTQLQVVVYELQDARSTLVAVREVATSEHHTPISMGWQADEVLVVFLQSLTGGAIATVSPRGPRDAAIVYGGRDGAAPGRLMEGVAAKSGLIAALFRSTQDSATQLVLLNYAQGAAARPLNVIEQLGVPSDASSVQVRPREDATGSHDVTLGFEDGAVKVWHCAPA